MSRTCPLCNGTGELPETKKNAGHGTLFDGHPETVEIDQAVPLHSAAKSAEKAAALRIAPHAGTIRRRVLDLAIAAGEHGITSIEATRAIVLATDPDLFGDALELAVRRKLYSVAPRLTELVDGEWLADSDDTRNDRMIYRVTAKALGEEAAAS